MKNHAIGSNYIRDYKQILYTWNVVPQIWQKDKKANKNFRIANIRPKRKIVIMICRYIYIYISHSFFFFFFLLIF